MWNLRRALAQVLGTQWGISMSLLFKSVSIKSEFEKTRTYFLSENLISCLFNLWKEVDHERRHTGVKAFPCDECSAGFNTKFELKHYKGSRHGGEEVPRFYCPKCSKSYTQDKALRDHMNMHLGFKPHLCPTCGESFTYQGQ
ncbi:unnamed protein product [Cyprideis torosa]|uniref:Uncharacterized protein n=1 Tax=Cyprideis torosa TaxID=163714 RepID=A0A7R8WBW6_9CRUS|nr:unnamed protein product [Cyprideis torosa]CAG0887436.1 unnamed protein product [Cyprideis torosa]